jgi:hypothetical protein
MKAGDIITLANNLPYAKSERSSLPNSKSGSLSWRTNMHIRRLRARIDKLQAAMFKRSRMAELKAKLESGDLTPEEDREALSLDRRWPSTKAAIMADWERQFKRHAVAIEIACAGDDRVFGTVQSCMPSPSKS